LFLYNFPFISVKTPTFYLIYDLQNVIRYPVTVFHSWTPYIVRRTLCLAFPPGGVSPFVNSIEQVRTSTVEQAPRSGLVQIS